MGTSSPSHCLDFQLQREEGGTTPKLILDACHWGKGNVEDELSSPSGRL